jgi:hypothetical protein
MIIVKGLKVSRQLPAEEWKKRAVEGGTIDEYGNSFRIIKLRWNTTRLHRNADHAKTRGFEDAVIGKNRRTGDLEVTYRQNGSVEWMRPSGGVGAYMGEVAETPRNMRLLASMYSNKLFTIIDSDIAEIVKKMHEKRVEKSDEATKKLNERMHRNMHTMSVEGEDTAVDIPVEAERAEIKEEKARVEKDRVDVAKRKAELDAREAKVTKKTVDMIGEGVEPTIYGEDFLKQQKVYKLRGICREMKLKWSNDEKKDDLVKKILAKQAGDMEKVKKEMAGIIGGGLDE